MRVKHRSWYVSYRVAHGTAMTVAKDRDEAIDTACAMLDRGVDIENVGPMMEAPEGNLIGPAKIREIHKLRLAAWHRLSAEKADSPHIWERRIQAAEDLEEEVRLKAD